MWVAKLHGPLTEGVITRHIFKFKVTFSGYPISAYKVKNNMHAVVAGVLIGDETQKAKCIRSLKKDPEVLHFEDNGSFFIAAIVQPKWSQVLYNPYVILVRPACLSSDGTYTYEFGSWNRSILESIAKTLLKHRLGKLISISQKKVGTIALMGMIPNLTLKQRQAVSLAVSNGYYHFPRKIELRQLAKQMHCALSTYREHLRIAEKKIIPASV